MDAGMLQRLLMSKGPGHPLVARALAELPDEDPLKADFLQSEAAQVAEVSRLDDLEARVAALEALA